MPGSPQQTQTQLAPLSWAQFPIAAGYSGTEPYGGGPKPDINIGIPYTNYPITSLTQGTVTNIDKVSPWGYAVTVKMDSPYNNVATHAAYLHLTTIDQSLYVGKHLQEGDPIGTGGNGITGSGQQKGAGVGFAFYNGDAYGYGPTWNQYVGSPKLDPTSFYKTFSSGSSATFKNANNIIAAQNASNTGCDTPVIGGLICWIQSQLATWALTVGFFLLGLVLIILGFVILIHPNPETLVKGAEIAA